MTCAAYHLIILIAADVLALPRVGISVLGAGQSGRGNLTSWVTYTSLPLLAITETPAILIRCR